MVPACCQGQPACCLVWADIMLSMHTASGGDPFQLPAIVEVHLESFRSTSGNSVPAAYDMPHLVLLLADGSLLAYQAYARGPGDVGFARMHLPLLPAHTSGRTIASKAAASVRMTRFDSLGDGAGLFYRYADAVLPLIRSWLSCLILVVQRLILWVCWWQWRVCKRRAAPLACSIEGVPYSPLDGGGWRCDRHDPVPQHQLSPGMGQAKPVLVK